MNGEEKKVEKTIMTIKEYEREVQFAIDSSSVDSVALVEGFYGLLVSLGYHPYSVLHSMRDLAYENEQLLNSFEEKEDKQ